MKTSWNETEQIEAYLNGYLNAGDALLFDAKMLLEPSLQDKIVWQQKTYSIVRHYGRKQLLQEIETAHQKLFTQTEHISFAQKIRLLFKNR
ncbi:MAG: hypothetical protein ACXVAY_13670 [Mucilaginibacter sp.]